MVDMTWICIDTYHSRNNYDDISLHLYRRRGAQKVSRKGAKHFLMLRKFLSSKQQITQYHSLVSFKRFIYITVAKRGCQTFHYKNTTILSTWRILHKTKWCNKVIIKKCVSAKLFVELPYKYNEIFSSFSFLTPAR